MSRSPTHAFYLIGAHGPTYILFDDAITTVGEMAVDAATSDDRVGVLLCPLFGNDDLCAYRARREWAKALASAGHPTLRLDFPGTGDSAGGPRDPALLEAWTGALGDGAAWLRGEANCGRVVAIGIGLGGLLAYRAAALGAGIDDLVLWAVPSRGRTFVRELRALAGMEASHEPSDASHSTSAQGALSSAGFLLSTETIAALEALDLAELELSKTSLRRVLMLERDGLAVDRRLRTTLEQSGVELRIEAGPGYGSMVAPPQQSQAPDEVIAYVGRWLLDIPTTPSRSTPPVPVTFATSLDLQVDGTPIRERPIALACADGQLMGILSEPEKAARLCAILLNAGALRHIGPNRMWVETARRWAAQGVPTLRIDMTGIGDADGDASSLESNEGFYVLNYVEEILELLDALSAQGMPQRFVLCGLCSGAYWAFHAALKDDRVRAAYLINPRALFWKRSISGVRDARNVRKALYLRTWRKLLSGQITRERIGTIVRGIGVTLAALPDRLRTHLRNRARQTDDLGLALERLSVTGAELLGIFTAEEPVYEELEREGGLRRMREHPNVHIDLIPGPLTSHTLEPPSLQQAVHARLDEALLRLLTQEKNQWT